MVTVRIAGRLDIAAERSPRRIVALTLRRGRVTHAGVLLLALLFAAGLWAGAQNALAGGGSFVTLPALILTGLDPRLANITSTVALFPGQVTTGWAGRSLVAGAERLSFRALAIISLVGGVAGALVLLVTPS